MPAKGRDLYNPTTSPAPKRTMYGSKRSHAQGGAGDRTQGAHTMAAPSASTAKARAPPSDPEDSEGDSPRRQEGSDDGSDEDGDDEQGSGSGSDSSADSDKEDGDLSEDASGNKGEEYLEADEDENEDTDEDEEPSRESPHHKRRVKPKKLFKDKHGAKSSQKLSASDSESSGLDMNQLNSEEQRQLADLLRRASKRGPTSSTTERLGSSSTTKPARQTHAGAETSTKPISKAISNGGGQRSKSKAGSTKQDVVPVDSKEKDERAGEVDIVQTVSDRMLTQYVQRILLKLGGWSNMYEMSDPQYDGNGKPVFWTKPEGGNLRPQWDRPFDENWQAWGEAFIQECRRPEDMGGNAEYLGAVSGDDIKDKLRHVTWKHCMTVWKSKKTGAGDEHRLKKQIDSCMCNRVMAKVKERTSAIKGTVLDTPQYTFLVYRELQSPEVSDAEDRHHAVIEEPEWRSAEYRQILGALGQKIKGSRKRTSAAKKDKTDYLKVDTPIPALFDGKRIPMWIIDKTWAAKHKAELEEKAYMIDKTAAKPPASYKTFIELYGQPNRTYVSELPPAAKPRFNSSSRSVSPVSTRRASVAPSLMLSRPAFAPQPSGPAHVQQSAIDPSLEGAPTQTEPQWPPTQADLSAGHFGLQLNSHVSSKSAAELAVQYAAQSTTTRESQAYSEFDHYPGPSMPPPFVNLPTTESHEEGQDVPEGKNTGKKPKEKPGKKGKEGISKKKRGRKDDMGESLEGDAPIEAPSASTSKPSSGKVKRVKLTSKGF